MNPQDQNNPQPVAPATPTNQPNADQLRYGMSASQMGYSEPTTKFFNINPKRLLIKSAIALVVGGIIFIALVLTNVIALNEFKNTSYTNAQGTAFTLSFYTKHSTAKLGSGNTQLVSKVSKDGGFPLALSIATTGGVSGYNRIKDCSGYAKQFEVENPNLKQTIAVCELTRQAVQGSGGAVYVAGFTSDNKSHTVTIAQDYGSTDLTSPSGARESLTRFGLEPYKADIEHILSSIKVK